MKSRNLNNIDIQILDEFARYIEFNNIDWNLTIQIIIYRNTDLEYRTLNLSNLPQILDNSKKENNKEKNISKKDKDLEEFNFLTQK